MVCTGSLGDEGGRKPFLVYSFQRGYLHFLEVALGEKGHEALGLLSQQGQQGHQQQTGHHLPRNHPGSLDNRKGDTRGKRWREVFDQKRPWLCTSCNPAQPQPIRGIFTLPVAPELRIDVTDNSLLKAVGVNRFVFEQHLQRFQTQPFRIAQAFLSSPASALQLCWFQT